MALEERIELDEIDGLRVALERHVPRTMFRAVQSSLAWMLRRVVKDRMSGQVLGVVTGTGRRSMAFTVRQEANKITGELGTPLKYIAAHELGFRGAVQVKAHTRRIVAPAVRGSGKITKKSTRELKKAYRSGRATTAFVRAHARKVNIRARHFIRDTTREGRIITRSRALNALEILAKTQRPPTVSEIGEASGPGLNPRT